MVYTVACHLHVPKSEEYIAFYPILTLLTLTNIVFSPLKAYVLLDKKSNCNGVWSILAISDSSKECLA
jgi:hypothetical protein